ncbi:MAG: phospholipase C [Terriglobales bacterium]
MHRRLPVLGLCVFALMAAMCGCQGLTGGARRAGNPEMNVVNHVVILMQENRSFDSYFGLMTAYRQANGIPINSSDGKINDLTGITFTNTVQPGIVIPAAHTGSVCTETLTPDWAESHKMMNLTDPSAAGPNSPMDGFAQTAQDVAQFAKSLGVNLVDQTGVRAMHFFDWNDLNYYYFMASQFAMSDAMFSPLPARTAVNRMYFHAATSHGHAHDPTTTVPATTIWEELQAGGILWKIYITDNPPNFTYLSIFDFFNDPGTASHIVPLSEYFEDVKNGTLPAVSFIETGMASGRDEHPSNFNPEQPGAPVTPINVQVGAQYASTIINALMESPLWKESVFFWVMDEGGGMFDHVPPIRVPNPDGRRPQDLRPDDPPGDFTITGFRVPNFIVSPFAKKNFVSHTPMDFTAILGFIQARWNLRTLTERDAAMPDMTEFFDFTNPPWMAPPTPPAQNMNGVCDFSRQ